MDESKKNKLLIFIALLVIIFITLAIIIPKFPIFVVKRTFDYAVYNIVNVSGLSPWLVKGILVFALMPFYWALLELSKMFSSRKKLAKFIIAGYSGLYFLTMFFVSRGSYFQMYDGKPIKYYAETPEGIKFYDKGGHDPKYGIELKPVTPTIVEQYIRQKRGLIPKRIEILSPEDYEYFDKITSKPKVWYYRDENGKYEFFDGPGSHPVHQVKLMPITPEVIQDYIKIKKEELKKEKIKQFESYRNKFLNVSFINSPTTKEVSVLAVDNALKERNDIESIIASIIKSLGLNPVIRLFREPFIREGLFDTIFSGDISKIEEFQLSNHTDYIIFVKTSSKIQSNPELSNLLTCNFELDIKIISTENGKLIDSTKLLSKGAGFTESDAENNAINILKDKIEGFLRKSLE